MEKMFLPFLSVSFIVISFLLETPIELFSGYIAILSSPSILVTDYLTFGLGPTFLNAGILLGIFLLMLKLTRISISGPVFAGLCTIIGFSFFGKNILNTSPIVFGVWLYIKYNKISIRQMIIPLLFSTGIAPVVSYIIFGIGLKFYFSVPLGLAAGVIIGFITPPLSIHTMKFHSGYTLYNTGFALGIISIIINGILYTFNISVKANNIVENSYHNSLLTILIGLSLLYIIIAIVSDKYVLKKYPLLLSRTGRLLTDYFRDYGKEATMLNSGLLGIICIIIVMVMKIKINSLIFGGIFAIIGFGSLGMHPRNVLPPMLGTIAGFMIMYFLSGQELNSSSIFFVASLAPISGRYGFITGFFAGFAHYMILPICHSFQGGFDLYNNGFASGFIAALFIPLLETFKKNDSKQ